MSIVQYVGRRLVLLVFVLLGVTMFSFLLVNVVPGDPARVRLGAYATDELIAVRRAEMGLDKPLWEQYVIYVSNALKGDLGTSYRTSHPVVQDIQERLPQTIELAVSALLIAALVGIPLGIAAAVRRHSIFDYVCTFFGVLGVSAPVFWVGLVLIVVFVTKLHLFPPPMGQIDPFSEQPDRVTGLLIVDSLFTGNWPVLLSALHHLALPALALSLLPMAPLTRMTRSVMIETLQSDFVRAARAIGLPQREIIFRVALRNALIPIVTLLGILLGYLIGGQVLVETVFNWNGIGQYLTRSIMGVDYAPVQSLVLLIAIFYALMNLVIDVLYFMIDPRIRVT